MICTVIATGHSLTASQVEAVRETKVVAVSNAYRMAPWAFALASSDAAWWNAYPEAYRFAGRKFSVAPIHYDLPGVERIKAPTHTNSGLLGIKVAESLGATRILLIGFDMHGDHFFGKHEELQNPGEKQFARFINQFKAHKPAAEIINCTEGSRLDCFPFGKIEDYLC